MADDYCRGMRIPSQILSFSFALAAFSLNLFGDETPGTATRIDLDGKPLQSAPNATVPRDGHFPAITEVTTPNLQIFRTTIKPSMGTILLFPGGGYHVLAIEHEGLNVAKVLNAAGYDVALLEYSINSPDARSKALADAKKAVNLIVQKGSELGINSSSLGVMGFSAGGHLASCLVHEVGSGVHFSEVILIYPAYLDAPGGLSPEVTPPAGISSRVFVLVGDKDKPEWVASSEAYVAASKANGQQAEHHLLPDTGHGFGMKSGQKPPASNWPSMLLSFLKGSVPGSH
jgi:dienelactone hydrolase